MIQTSINKDYQIRLLGVGAVLFALAGWFLYDGLIAYPRENAAVAPICQQLAEQKLTPRQLLETPATGVSRFAAAFEAVGQTSPSHIYDLLKSVINANAPEADNTDFATALLTRPVHSDGDIQAQYTSAGIAAFFGACLFGLLAMRRRVAYTLDGDTLTIRNGAAEQKLSLANLKSISWRNWATKRIAVLSFQDGTSKTLDAWHYFGIEEIAAAIESARPDLARTPPEAASVETETASCASH